jgi:hypothetical protein
VIVPVSRDHLHGDVWQTCHVRQVEQCVTHDFRAAVLAAQRHLIENRPKQRRVVAREYRLPAHARRDAAVYQLIGDTRMP